MLLTCVDELVAMLQASVAQHVCREFNDVDTPQALHHKIKEGAPSLMGVFAGVSCWAGVGGQQGRGFRREGLANQEVLPKQVQGHKSARGGRETEGGWRGAKKQPRRRGLAGGGGADTRGLAKFCWEFISVLPVVAFLVLSLRFYVSHPMDIILTLLYGIRPASANSASVMANLPSKYSHSCQLLQRV